MTSLHQYILANKSSSVDVCRCVYPSIVAATLLYGSETWPLKADQPEELRCSTINIFQIK